jgi:hypothetical protein
MVAEVPVSIVQTSEGPQVLGISRSPLLDPHEARFEVGPQDRVVDRHGAGHTRMRQTTEPFRKDVAVNDDRVAALGEVHRCSSDRPAEYFVLWADSGRHGSTQPVTTNDMKSSISIWTLGSLAAATIRPTVVLPAPDGPATTRIGAATPRR